MKKITTFFKKDPNDLSKVINEMDPKNEWVLTESIATRKFDGTPAAIIGGKIYKRYNVKKGRPTPNGIPCQEPDTITGEQPFWVKCDRAKPEDKYFFQAFDLMADKFDGTYELCGEKVQGNPEQIKGHQLIRHGKEVLKLPSLDFMGLKQYLYENDIEGIVFHHEDGRMCKIRKKDFGIKRKKKDPPEDPQVTKETDK